MKSAKCPECGFVGWADAEVCKKCGAPLMASSENASMELGQQNSYDYPMNSGMVPPQLKTGLAITSLVVGILNFLFLGILGVTIIAGIVISIAALKKLKRNQSQYW